VAEAAREVAKYSLDARVTVEDGSDALDRATSKDVQLVLNHRLQHQGGGDLGERSEQIGLIFDVINPTSRTRRTCLLSTRRIEAARVGEHGQGFGRRCR